MNWNFISVVVQLIQTLAVILALFYTWKQVKSASQGLRLGALWEIFKELDNFENQKSRSYIYKNRLLYKALENKESGALEKLSSEDWEHAQRVSTSFNRVGYAVYHGLVPEQLILDGYHHVIARSWIVLEPFIKYVRENRSQIDYQPYFELLAEKTFKNYVRRDQVLFTDEN